MSRSEPIGLSALRQELLCILRGAAGNLRAWRWWYLGSIVLAGLLLGGVVMPHDHAILDAVRMEDSPTADAVASALSRIGKTDGTTLVSVLVLLVAGIAFRRARARRVGLCLILAVIVSGVGVNVLRPAFGRARPYAGDAGAFTWASMDHAHNSFPSGHCSEAWTFATVISCEFPPAAIPVCAYAGSMMWARMQRNQHFPADVTGGMLWGILCALPFALRRKGQNRV